jgi:tripartite-type tricarboxylate transporter receptor subunit TctC
MKLSRETLQAMIREYDGIALSEQRCGWAYAAADGSRPPLATSRRITFMQWSVAADALVAFAVSAHAEQVAYPTKSIRMLVGFPPGGGADVVARSLAPRMSETLGQQIVVDNRPGAGSALASEMVARSAPDGYTLVSIGSTHAVNAAVSPQLSFRPAADFSGIVLLATTPVLIAAHPSVAATNLKELMALARAQPGKLNYGSAGVNGINHLAAELLKHTARLDIAHVPYKGVAQALPAVMAGEVQLLFATLPGTIAQVRAGRIKALAVTTARRSPSAPNIPSVAESGVPGFEASSWFAFLAPVGTPRAIVMRLNAEAVKALQSTEIRESFVRQGMDPIGSTPAEIDAHLREEIAKWTQVVKSAGIKTQ